MEISENINMQVVTVQETNLNIGLKTHFTIFTHITIFETRMLGHSNDTKIVSIGWKVITSVSDGRTDRLYTATGQGASITEDDHCFSFNSSSP